MSTGRQGRALVIQTAFLGDVVLTTPLLSRLAERFETVDVVTTPLGARALAGLPGIRPIGYQKRGGRGVWAEMQHLKSQLQGVYQDVFAVHRSPRSLLIGRMVQAQRRVAFDSWWARALGYQTVPYGEYTESLHYIERALRLADLPNGLSVSPLTDVTSTNKPRPRLAVPQQLGTEVDRILKNQGITGQYLVSSPFSNWGTKMWPLERHIRVAIQVAQAKGLGVVILGDNPRHRDLVTKALVEFVDKESHKYEPPSPGFPGFSVVNLVGQTTVEEYAALISKCTLVITNDSASTHIAAAFDRPCVVVFGPTSLKWGFGPRSTHSAVAEVPLPCRPCHIHGPHICPLGHFRCMNDITVAMVKERALSLLAAPRNPTHNPTT